MINKIDETSKTDIPGKKEREKHKLSIMKIIEVTSLHILQTKNNNKECYGQLSANNIDIKLQYCFFFLCMYVCFCKFVYYNFKNELKQGKKLCINT